MQNNNNVPTKDSTLLSKFVKLDPLQAPPYDTIEVIQYKYDSLKRLTTVLDLFYNNTGAPDSTSFGANQYWIKSNLYYDAAEILPYKTIVAIFNFGSRVYDTIYHSYDAVGRIINDSTRRSLSFAGTLDNGFFVHQYIYNNSMIYLESRAANGAAYDTVLQQTSNGNIIYQKDSRQNPAAQTPSATSNFTFDTHPNPLYKNGFGNEPIYGFAGGNADDGIQRAIQKNNYTILKESIPISSGGTNDLSLTFQYTYRSDGYPLHVILGYITLYYPYSLEATYVYNK